MCHPVDSSSWQQTTERESKRKMANSTPKHLPNRRLRLRAQAKCCSSLTKLFNAKSYLDVICEWSSSLRLHGHSRRRGERERRRAAVGGEARAQGEDRLRSQVSKVWRQALKCRGEEGLKMAVRRWIHDYM